MSIDVVPQPRIDHLVTGVDGSEKRRTDHRGMVWFGGRQAAQTGGMVTMRHHVAAIVTPFWLPDGHAYATDAVDRITVTIAASALFVAENCALAEISARLVANDANPAYSHVMVHLQGNARVPLGVSYDITVLAPPDSVAAA